MSARENEDDNESIPDYPGLSPEFYFNRQLDANDEIFTRIDRNCIVFKCYQIAGEGRDAESMLSPTQIGYLFG